MPFTWILPSRIEFQLVATATPLSLLIGPLVTIGRLASTLSPRQISSLRSAFFRRQQVDWLVRPPSGDPEASPDEYWLIKRTHYGLRRSPCHWYDKINAILCSICLMPSLEDPCLYTGYIHDPANPSASALSAPLSIGVYVDNFVYISKDPAVEALFCRLLSERCKVDFMGIVEWFLGIYFSWRVTSSSVSVHMNQSGFATNLVRASPSSLVMRHQQPPPTDLASPLILLLPQLTPMTPRPRSVAKKPFKVLCHLPHGPTSLRPTPSYPLTRTNPPPVT